MSIARLFAVVTGFALITGIGLRAAQEIPQDAQADRFLAHVSTDKPIYRAGERVFVRAVLLGADNHRPLPDGRDSAVFRISGPKGETLGTSYATIQQSIAGYAWNVPADAAGGQYKIVAEFPSLGFPPAERKFEIRAYRAPRLKGEIIFLRDGFGPGDVVKASLHVERAEGGVPAGGAVSASAIVDGARVYQGQTIIDPAGNCSVQFKLPDQIVTGDGTLSLAITDGGVVEPIAKTIPILVNTVDISFYPEGGDMVAGLPSRIYVESRTHSRKPADIVGKIVDPDGHVVADVKTEHEGRGRFTFTPRPGITYNLKLSQPTGIGKLFPLPAPIANGIVLTSASDITAADQPVKLQCASSTGGDYTVTLSKHGQQFSSQMLDLKPGKPADISLEAPDWADGALVITARDGNGKALAERLVFRQPDHSLHVTVKSDKESYVPGDPVLITVTTTDDNGRPVPATVGITASDTSVLQIPEQRDCAPRLSEMALLEDDVRELAEPQKYLDLADPRAPLVTDLLLGTQGWRRFATVDEAAFLTRWGDAGRRALANRQPAVFLGPTGGVGFGGGSALNRGAGGNFFQARAASANGERLVLNGSTLPTSSSAAVQDALPQADFRIDENIPQDQDKAKFLRRQLVRPNGNDVRIYVHDLRPGYQPGQRQDFTETLYWSAGVATDTTTGSATVSFKLNDAVTSFKISADAFDANGALGEGTATIHSIQPFYVEPKLPLEVSAGDVIRLPIAVVNGTGDPLPVKFSIDGDPSLSIGSIPPFNLPAGGRDRRIAEITVGALPATANIHITAQAGSYSDQVTRQLVIKPVGFPTEISRGGMLNANDSISQSIEIPTSVVTGSIVSSIALYPTPVGNLTEALKRLMQEPNGCFEQTTSTTYPLVMADQYFLSHSGVAPALVQQCNDLLGKGYDRLIGFECKSKGYEWFGEDPGHECLSAYAVLEFTDMSAVRNVDQNMLQETRSWLMSHRDGKGGFTHDRPALHTWVTDPDCANGYCLWALLEAGQKDLGPEVQWFKNAATKDSNSYVKALAANVMWLAGDHEAAKQFMDDMAKKQESDGHVAGATTSVVGSEGDSLQIETTSLAVLAWLREPTYAANDTRAITFLADSCQGGRYGSTQSTVLALRAIVEYDRARAHPTASGKVQLTVDGQPVGGAFAFSADTQGVLKLPDVSDRLTPGKHEISLKMIDGSQMPYAVDVTYHSVTPASSDQCKIGLTVALKDTKLVEGSTTEAEVTITNRADSPVPTPVAIIGLPGGLEVRYDQLKELVKAQRIAAYEVRGREVILYWRDLSPSQRIDIPLSLTAAVPGDYTGPASRAYLYYTDENKQWVDGLKVQIASRSP